MIEAIALFLAVLSHAILLLLALRFSKFKAQVEGDHRYQAEHRYDLFERHYDLQHRVESLEDWLNVEFHDGRVRKHDVKG